MAILMFLCLASCGDYGSEGEETDAFESALSNSYVTTYSSWSASAGGLWNIDARFRAIVRPGTNIQYYYARQGGWTNAQGDDGWYMGLQTDGTGPNTNTAIFSIWNARDAQATDPNAHCLTFGNEGTGRSCRLAYNWVAGRTYRLRVWRQNDGWWLSSIYDETGGTERIIGRIRARAGQGDLAPWITDFVEYYGPDFPSCASLQPSRATFLAPTGNNGGVGFGLTGSSEGSGACSDYRAVRQGGSSTEHLMGMEGPYLVRTVLPGSRCLDAGGGGLGAYTYMRDCNLSNGNLRWFRHADGGLSSDTPGYRCLDANTGAFGKQTYMRDCNPANANLRWYRSDVGSGHDQIRSVLGGNRCLDANTGAFGRNSYLRDCDGGQNANLRWIFERH
jgi:hypothetical protein